MDTKVSFIFAQQFRQRGKVQPTRPRSAKIIGRIRENVSMMI
jgi:hypothetical protein